MKKFLVVACAAVFAASALAVMPAFAGDCGGGGGGCGSAGGFSASNACPLAKQANTMRSTGREAMALSNAMRASLAASVRYNVAKI